MHTSSVFPQDLQKLIIFTVTFTACIIVKTNKISVTAVQPTRAHLIKLYRYRGQNEFRNKGKTKFKLNKDVNSAHEKSQINFPFKGTGKPISVSE